MEFYKKLKFVTKVQIGFLAVGLIAAVVIMNNFIMITQVESAKDEIFADYVVQKGKVDSIYTEFKGLQFTLLKFSNPMFDGEFDANLQKIEKSKKSIDNILKTLVETTTNAELKAQYSEVQTIWTNYRNVVADAILSAAVTKDYEMAAVVASSSGEEVGTQLETIFAKMYVSLQNRARSLDVYISDTVSSTKWFMIGGNLLGIIITLLALFYLAPALSKPIKAVQKSLSDFSLGDFTHEMEVTSQDEFGEIAEMVNVLRASQLDKVNAAVKISNGELVTVNVASENDQLAIAFNSMNSTIVKLLGETEKINKASLEGDLSVRGDASQFRGRWKSLLEGLNSILGSMVLPIDAAAKVLDQMATGDFTHRMTGDFKGVYKSFQEDVNKVIDSMNDILNQTSDTANELALKASQISSSTEEMAAGAQEQSTQSAEVAAAIEEMASTIMETTKNASNVAKNAQENGEFASESGKAVEETVSGMNRIAVVVANAARTVQELGKSSNQIGEIIQVIDEIADQTNLLALNAAIEAARAGEQGRGFAVVADEVRKLAERTTKATKEIATMIKQIQKDTQGAVTSINEGTREVEKGKTLANQAGQAMSKIVSGTLNVVDLITQVASASEEQSATAEQISKSIDSISQVTQETATGIQEIARTSEDLNMITESLQTLINRFKILRESGNSNRDERSLGGGSHGRRFLN